MLAKSTPAARDVCIAAGAACALWLAARPAAAELPLDAGAIGVSIQTLVRALGAPAEVSSGDSGNRFVFAGGAITYADDDGVVLAIELRAGSPRLEVDGSVRSFPIGVYSRERADAELAAVAEFSTAALRSYRLAPRRDLVLDFSPGSNRLERLTYGEPGQLARLGLLPGDAAATAVAYRAPQLRRTSTPADAGSTATTAAGGGPGNTTVFRLTVDRGGGVSEVDVAVGSADPAGDAAAARRLRGQRYAPALLDGRPIAGTVFIEIRH